MRNYEQASNEKISVQAKEALMDMYSEWTGHEKESIHWAVELYEYFMKTRQYHKLFPSLFCLTAYYVNTGNKEKAKEKNESKNLSKRASL